MTADMELFYWQSNPEWWYIGEDGEYHLTEMAPERAIKSFEEAIKPRSEKLDPFRYTIC